MFGLGNRIFNNGENIFKKFRCETIELQRLVIEENMGKNVLSYFVSSSLNLLKKPTCVYSYADSNYNHHGYIYQATNFIYTGISKPRRTFFDTIKKEFIHERTLSGIYGTSSVKNLPSHIVIDCENGGKYRYFYFCANKRDKKIMNNEFLYKSLPYPKGENRRYEFNQKQMATQALLF